MRASYRGLNGAIARTERAGYGWRAWAVAAAVVAGVALWCWPG